jgi:hypothetical protein
MIIELAKASEATQSMTTGLALDGGQVQPFIRKQ